MPKVSVITGYYNRGDHLEPTIRSILDQSFTDLELFVFDDASPDGTGKRLIELAEKIGDPRLKPVLHETNKGFTQGMIDAIALSSGEYIAVQGSGDISLPTRIERQVAYLEEHPDVGAVGCWYTNVVAETNARRPREPDATGIDFQTLLRGNVFSHGEVMMRRSAYEAAGGYHPAFRNCQDYNLWLRIIKNAKLATVREQLYDRYVRMDGVSYDPKKFAVQARYFLLAQRLGAMDAEKAQPQLDQLAESGPLSLVPHTDGALQARYFKAALRSIVWGASKEATTLARESITSWPKRTAIIVAAGLLDTPVGRPARRVVQKLFGVE